MARDKKMNNNINVVTDTNKKYLYNLVSKLALRDYRSANQGKRKFDKYGNRISRPYSLAHDTSEAHNYYTMALRDDLTIEEVGQVKAFINLQKIYGN